MKKFLIGLIAGILLTSIMSDAQNPFEWDSSKNLKSSLGENNQVVIGRPNVMDAKLGVYVNHPNFAYSDLAVGLYSDFYNHQSASVNLYSTAAELYNNYEAGLGVTNESSQVGCLSGVMVSSLHRGTAYYLIGSYSHNRIRDGAGGNVLEFKNYLANLTAWGPNTLNISRNYAFYAAELANLNGATIVDNYGLYISPMKSTGITNGWGIYSEGTNDRSYIAGKIGIGKNNPVSKIAILGLLVYANNAAAIGGGLGEGDFYRTGGDPDQICVVH